MILRFSEELALKWLAKQHEKEHRAPESSEFYAWILEMVLIEEFALRTMRVLLDKGWIVYHDNKVMHPLYFDEFYNEDFDALNEKYDFRNPETWNNQNNNHHAVLEK